jgi:GNAT superfamily N-acetyltransferase
MLALREEAIADLRDHASVPSVFEAASVFDVQQSGAACKLVERAIPAPYRKNYDEFEDPTTWPRDFDTRHWVLIAAYSGACRIGGAIVARTTPGVAMLEGRSDLALLWDLRVSPAQRRRAAGTALLHAAVAWARRHGCTEMRVETQNTNPAACKFYMHNGFVISKVRQGAYANLPQDVQLIWSKKLAAWSAASGIDES